MQEWFQVDLNLAKKTIETILAFTDSQIKNIETFIPIINTTINTLPANAICVKGTIISDNTLNAERITLPMTNPLLRQGTTDNTTDNITDNTTKINEVDKTIQQIVNKSNDFDGFLENSCEIGENHFTAKEELTKAFRIYSKNTIEKQTKELFNSFLQKRFRSGVEFYENIRRNVWRGFRLKPLTFSVNDSCNIQDFEQFILDKCQINYLNRISYVDFFDAFVEYKKQNDSNYILTHPIKQKIQMYLTNSFANGRVHLSNQKKAKHLFGVLGLSLQNISGLKETKRTCKKVSKFDCQTNECINTWDSLTIAAKELNIPRSTLATFIKFQTVKENYIFKYD